MNMKKEGSFAVVALLAANVFASGFGLYEASSPAYALGGAVIGRAYDASANFFNPATLTDLTNITVTLGCMTEHPRGRMKSDVPNGRTTSMDPGVFFLPHFHLAVPLPWDFAFGLGVMPEYGLGSEYADTWDLSFNSIDTTVMSFTVNPNLAYRITDKWSVGAGLRFLFFDFEQHSIPVQGVRQRLKGDNDMEDLGWQVGTKYDILDNFAVGLVYKSKTDVHVSGKSDPSGYEGLPAAYAAQFAAIDGPARTKLELPQSITLGCNWDITRTWHLGTMVAWTDWSSVDTLDFKLNKVTKPINLKWKDTWRFGIAPSWDCAENWTALASYVFETDCCGDQDSTMLPPSERHMISSGLVWHFTENLDFGFTYGIILMDGEMSNCTNTSTGQKYHYSAHRALSHAAGFTVTYRF